MQEITATLDYRSDIHAWMAANHPQTRYKVLRKSLDARKSNKGVPPKYLYRIELSPEVNDALLPQITGLKKAPVIVGFGPAGLFAAIRFADQGVPAIVLERGESVEARPKKIARFWREGVLDPESNVCYGEGGAGLFSDGKLGTRIKSPHKNYVLKRLVDFGADPSILFESHPHLGSDRMRAVLKKAREYLLAKGAQIHFNTRVDDLLVEQGHIHGVKTADGRTFEADHVLLATGHSPFEVYSLLKAKGVSMNAKDFAVGVRIEHPRALIDKLQYGPFANDPLLGASRYELSWQNTATRRGVYSFCMCPGGYVVSSSTDHNELVTNGMSYSRRNGFHSNSALIVSIRSGEDFDNTNPLSGFEFQKKIERAAWDLSKKQASGKELPCMTVGEFLSGKIVSREVGRNSSLSGAFKADWRVLFPAFVNEHLREGLLAFDKNFPGLCFGEALLFAPETRTSSPVTISRNPDTSESVSHKGLFPCGEGSGYAGGITSSAVDGIKAALSVLSNQW